MSSETLNPTPNDVVPSDPPASEPTLLKRKREDPLEPESDPNTNPEHNPLWKSTLCSYFRSSITSCSHGDTCRFAHGEAELRARPDGSWDPSSERVKQARKEEEDEVEDDVMMTEAFDNDDDDKWLGRRLGPLPRKWTADDLKDFLNDKGISFKSAKKKKGMILGFLNFDNSEQAKAAMEGLEGKVAGNKTVKLLEAMTRSFDKKRSGAMPSSQDNGTSEKAESCDQADDSLVSANSDLKGRTARSVATPLSHLSYPDQLEHKKNALKQILKKLTRNGRKACPSGVKLPEWIQTAREKGGLPCKFEGIIESRIVDGYRNKCEFSVGYSSHGKPTVGFLLGNFREGVIAVEEPTDCLNVSRIACRYAAIFQEVIQNSGLPLWNRMNNVGFWRQLTVREGRMPATEDAERSVSEVLLMVQVCMSGFDEVQVKDELERMAQAFSHGAATESSPLPLTALVVQDHTGISNVAPSDAPLHFLPIPRKESEHITGTKSVDAVIHDYISNLQFQISATAFFQVNTLAAEKLYALAGDWADLGPDTLLFDVCCGTGTIGLTLAHRVGMVVGIEMNASAVADAHRNAEINGIKNCRFVCAKAEDVMGSLLKEYLSTSPKDEELSIVLEKDDDEIKISKETVTPTELQEGSASEHECDGSNPTSLEDGPTEDGLLQKDVASKTMPGSELHFKNVVAIVDPPRGGLHPTVIRALRTHEHLRRLVYISCNPDSLMANAIELCTPCADKAEKGKDNRGWRKMSNASLARKRVKSMPNSEPFKPVKAMAVDLFPHTTHCELVMLLER